MMAGLLDSFDDPGTQGLLSLGLRLMSAPGRFGQALGSAGMGALSDMAATRDAAMKRKMMEAQMADYLQQAELRKQQAQKLSGAQDLLSTVLSGQGQPNQYGTAGNGVTMGGVREKMTPQVGGLAGATPEQMAALKASGIDIEKLWELARFGKEMQPGYRRNADGTVDYLGDPSKGLNVNRQGQVSLMPGAAESQASLAGATKAAESEAAARSTLGKFPVRTGPNPGDIAEVQMPVQDYIDQLRARLAGVPDKAAAGAASSGDKKYNFDIGGVKGAFNGVGVGPTADESAVQAANTKYKEGVVSDVLTHRKNTMSAAAQAPNKIASMHRIVQLLGDVEGGSTQRLGMAFSSAVKPLGITLDSSLGNKQAADAASKELALQLKQTGEGAGMPGALSDSDRQYLASMAPGLEQTVSGRKLIAEGHIALAQRQQQIAQAMRNYEKKHGQLDNGFFDQLQAWSNANPLFAGPKWGQ